MVRPASAGSVLSIPLLNSLALSLVVPLVGGCGFNPGGRATPSAVADGGAIVADSATVSDAPPAADVMPTCVAWPDTIEPSNLGGCSSSAKLEPLELNEEGTYTFDTDTGVLTTPGSAMVAIEGGVVVQDDAPEIYAVYLDSLVVGEKAELVVTGDRALALVTHGSLTLDGTLLVGGNGAENGPGGGHPAACQAGRGTPGVEQVKEPLKGGSGGGGGGFGGEGGDGAGVDLMGPDGDESPGGVENGSATLVPLRGGCQGGHGGATGSTLPTGLGGGGGGAIQLTAGDTLTIEGTVSAPGEGGGGVTNQVSHGGGGGGSGGGILLEANVVVVSGVVTANGGGGGEGSLEDDEMTDPGERGTVDSATSASGGSGGGFGGNGGAGGATLDQGTDGTAGSSDDFGEIAAGGGGGGGGVGRIQVRAITKQALQGALFSPQP